MRMKAINIYTRNMHIKDRNRYTKTIMYAQKRQQYTCKNNINTTMKKKLIQKQKRHQTYIKIH